jgi:isoleucyl-tRNA synthetase
VEKKALGVDVLRWWVAAHASSAASVMVGDAILAASKVDVDRIRNTVRFVLGLLEDKEQEGEVRLVLLDRAMLHRLHRHTAACAEHYEAMEYNKVCLASNAFLSQLSASYLHLLKDRLYCEGAASPGRRSGQAALLSLGRGLAAVLGPLMPHLTEEMGLCCPRLGSPARRGWPEGGGLEGQEALGLVEELEAVRDLLQRAEGRPGEAVVEMELGDRWAGLLAELAEPEREVAEVLGVLAATLTLRPDEEPARLVGSVKAELASCLRCRRLQAEQGRELCPRCNAVVSES